MRNANSNAERVSSSKKELRAVNRTRDVKAVFFVCPEKAGLVRLDVLILGLL